MPRKVSFTQEIKKFSFIKILFFIVYSLSPELVYSEDNVEIKDTFFLVSKPIIHARTGPGSRFPVRFSLQENVSVRSLNRRHLWIEVQTTDGKQGWVKEAQITPMPHSGEDLVPIFPLKRAKPNLLDDERWELGISTGMIHLEDFGSHSIVGLSGSYHLNEWAYLRTNYGTTTLDRPEFLDNDIDNDLVLRTSAQKRLVYYFASLGTYFFPRESYITHKTVWKSHISTDLGLGNTYINDKAHLSYRMGIGYSLFPMDWLSVNINTNIIRFNHSLFGNETTNNSFEVTLGLHLFL